MIECRVCKKDKNFNQYYATGRTMDAVCKTCLNTNTEMYKEKNKRNEDYEV